MNTKKGLQWSAANGISCAIDYISPIANIEEARTSVLKNSGMNSYTQDSPSTMIFHGSVPITTSWASVPIYNSLSENYMNFYVLQFLVNITAYSQSDIKLKQTMTIPFGMNWIDDNYPLISCGRANDIFVIGYTPICVDYGSSNKLTLFVKRKAGYYLGQSTINFAANPTQVTLNSILLEKVYVL